jgi:hypothetical protein
MTEPAAGASALDALLRSLIAVLRAERALYDDLLALTAAECDAVVNPTPLVAPNGPLPLQRIVAEKERCLVRLAELEERRTSAGDTLALAVGLTRQARLGDLCARLSEPAATVLQAERQLLLDRMRALAEANAVNAALLTSALQVTRATLSALPVGVGGAYGPDGRAPAPASVAPRLDRQA